MEKRDFVLLCVPQNTGAVMGRIESRVFKSTWEVWCRAVTYRKLNLIKVTKY